MQHRRQGRAQFRSPVFARRRYRAGRRLGNPGPDRRRSARSTGKPGRAARCPRATPPRDIRPAQAEAYVFTRHNILPCGSSAFDGDRLYFRLNNRLEHDVGQIERARRHHLNRHYGLISRLCIRISNREAAGYLLIGLALCALFGFTFAWLTLAGRRDPGHIYAVVSYLWSFAMSIDDAPHLPEEFYKIKDIGKRVHVEDA